MTRLIFLDTETTGIDPDKHQVWEVGAIVRDPMPEGIEKHMPDVEYHWFLYISLGKADTFALEIGKYWDRHPLALRHLKGEKNLATEISNESAFAHEFFSLSHKAHIIGAVPDFDTRFLAPLLKENGLIPTWNYHLIDVEVLLAGKLGIEPPYKWRDTLATVGIDMDKYEQHTALGDARLARDVYDWVMNNEKEEAQS